MGVGKGETQRGRESGRKEGYADALFALFPFQLAKAANTSLSCSKNSGKEWCENLPLPALKIEEHDFLNSQLRFHYSATPSAVFGITSQQQRGEQSWSGCASGRRADDFVSRL